MSTSTTSMGLGDVLSMDLGDSSITEQNNESGLKFEISNGP
jgi:hypothetical protein